jgi:hypothetical protein
MTGLVIPTVGEIELLNKMLIAALSVDETYTLKLYNNNIAPNPASTTDTFNEATFAGYAPKILNRSGWSAPTTVSDTAQTSYSQQSWTCTGLGDTIYGYYVIGSTSNVLLWAEEFSSPRLVGSTDILNLTPVFSFSSQN